MTKKGKKRQLNEVEANGAVQIVKKNEKSDEGTPKKKKLKTQQENVAEVKKPQLNVSKKPADADGSAEQSKKKKKKKKKNKNKEHDTSATSITSNKSPEKASENSKNSTNDKDSTAGAKRKESFKKKRKEFRQNERKAIRQQEGQFSSINNLSVDEMKKRITEIESRGDLSKTALRKLRTLKKKVNIVEMDSSVPENNSTEKIPQKSEKRKNDSSDKSTNEPENKKFKKGSKKEKHALKEVTTKDQLFFEDRQGNNILDSSANDNSGNKNKPENKKLKNKQRKLKENKQLKFEKKTNKMEDSDEESNSQDAELQDKINQKSSHNSDDDDSDDEQELNISKNIQKPNKKIKEIIVKKLEDGELESDEDEDEEEDEDVDEDEDEDDDADDGDISVKQEVLKSNKTMLKNKNFKKKSSDSENGELETESGVEESDKTPEKQIKKEKLSPGFKKQKQNETDASGKKKRYVLFIGNLAYDATTVDLKKHFLSKVEKVKDVRIPLKPKTNVPRGFAYVEVENSVDYEKALSLHDTFVKGRKIVVEYTSSGSKNGSKRPEVIHKNKKLHAMRKAGMLAGSKKDSQKRSFRRNPNNKPFKKNNDWAGKPAKAEN